MQGRLALVLHAHLPFVRHPEHERFYEEQWLFEAVAECYLPLLAHMSRWTAEGLNWRLALSLTPPLCAMLDDSLLQQRIRRYLQERVELAESEIERWHLVPPARLAAVACRDRFVEALMTWDGEGGKLLPAFRWHLEAGHLEILCCAATHAFLPFLLASPTFLKAQVELGVGEYRRHFGRLPQGIWLPECAYVPELAEVLAAAGLKWFPVEAHAFLYGRPTPLMATFRPVSLPNGLISFARDAASARQVWSRHEGYPGDPRYREFHQDIADHCEWGYVGRYLPGTENRVATGLKLHRVSGPGVEKDWYDRASALQAVQDHAAHFVAERIKACQEAKAWLACPPVIMAPFDAELFGHWWHEGPEFLDAVMRRLVASDSVAPATPGELWREKGSFETCEIAASTWGEAGYASVWLHPANGWIQPRLRVVEGRLVAALRGAKVASETPNAFQTRCLNQAAREVLLAQSSDWPFLLRMGTAGDYPAKRVSDHLEAAHQLLDASTCLGAPPGGYLEARERQYNLFPDLNAERLLGGES
ncbi:MAG TPA: 1,4-alpha-glucan branching protein domain-containing protein [Candidatus Limnocylindria bacterium]|nr:1,4-alpha-glucan branching protein domain-containing protein [Candidatus Limnocylindria bacterium]